ncbi:MAG: hypothetical protein U5K84_06940 [Alkalibacterium sp.]|nr:hypothetical protein [Alkalibacterium sp.]
MADKKEAFSNEPRENIVPDSFLKDTDSEGNEFVHTPADDVNETITNEAEKAEDTQHEDFEKFDVHKVDELKKEKNDDKQ